MSAQGLSDVLVTVKKSLIKLLKSVILKKIKTI